MKELKIKIYFSICKVKYIARKAIRKIRRKLHIKYEPKRKFGREYVDIESVQTKIFELIRSEKPFMVGRLGGVEGAAALDAFKVKKGWKSELNKTLAKNAQINAGFFPPDKEHLIKFSDLLQESLKQVDILGSMSTNDEEFLVKSNMPKQAMLTGIGNLEPYYSKNPWSRALEGKKVLIIYPFEESIKSQYAKREMLFEDKSVLPQFDLKVLKTVQSIAGTKTEFNDWFEALDYMYNRAMQIDFDIAIIGCGAYGFPLAAMLKKAGKQAIHLGGATQILFGIKGARWEKIPNVKCLFNEHWIRPLPSETPEEAKKVEDACYW